MLRWDMTTLCHMYDEVYELRRIKHNTSHCTGTIMRDKRRTKLSF